MEEKPSNASRRSLVHHDSNKSLLQGDIRNLWTTATLSELNVNLPLSHVSECSDLEGRRSSYLKGSVDTDNVDWEWDGGLRESLPGDDSSQQELDERTLMELELHRSHSLGSVPEGGDDDDSRIKAERSSSSLNVFKQTPHRAYWAEQQNRLPLPLVGLMENEVLEILTKTLESYRSGIGRNHFLTKQLRRSIEGLKKRRNKMLQVSVN
ncbi:cation channel sperm-associated protein subunit zeta [Orycteropus afer afer]|uniref:Cation channel sperm-associated protein subunit zeta n=1 Tax=Orycteropus afer afer TaxID=1230840 RepID=A0A8B7AAT8_ORYAF|nr:cation channel sperm-associated protein subunit zeta [Orycteropus afer afer]